MSKKKDLAPTRPRKRPYNPKRRKKRFLLYCEGEVTERDYFVDFARFLRTSLIEVEIASERRKDPKRLVELAKDRRNEADHEAKLARDDSLRFDEVWCVFDCDQHARLHEAVDQATSLGLDLAVSNPCFELWLLLHFQDQYGYISTKEAHEAVRRHIPRYGKQIELSKLAGNGFSAVNRARQMETIARNNGKWFDNPTTGVWHLIARLCEDSNVPLADI